MRPGLRYATANNKEEACVDIYASGFWEGKQTSECTILMSRLRLLHLHIMVATQVAILTIVYRCFEHEKQWKYEQRN